MDAWADNSAGMVSLTSPEVGIKGGSHILNYSDPLVAKVIEFKKELQAEVETNIENEESNNKPIIEMMIAACDGDLVTFESVARLHPELINTLYPSEDSGISSLIFAICFDQYAIAESILAQHNGDPDLHDTLVNNYTPLMWAIYFNQLDMVKLLLNHQADPYISPKDDDKTAISMVTPGKSHIYEYFKNHNLLKQKSSLDSEDYYESGFQYQEDPLVDNLTNQIKLQSITATSGYLEDEDHDQPSEDLDEEQELANDPLITSLKEFDYEKLLPEQYIKFTDSDIPSLLDYIFDLRTKKLAFQHDTKIPAAIVFQLLRYAYLKVDSTELSEFLFDCFTARLRSVTNTKSGVFNMATADDKEKSTGSGDIVLLSYWLSVIQFLHFYLSKNGFYTKFPKFLQELINLVQSLIATLSFSINSRLNLLIDDCILDFTNLVDVSNVLYAKDWNFFKGKRKFHPSTYEDIFDMLYPPSQTELMKPSPIRYIQVLNALDYVLKLHQVNTLIKFQTFSEVFYYINSIIFNRIISQSKYCTRSKAIQIRLNISTLEDWLRSHNYKNYKPDKIGQVSMLLGPANHLMHLSNLLEETNDIKNPHSLSFYYNSLYHIGKTQLQPTIELLQWLQCMSLLTDEESLIITINQFDYLNYYQLFKIMNKLYKYEVNEPKLPKTLTNLIKNLQNQKGESQVSQSNLHYMTQSNFLLKEVYIYLNPNYVFAVALPNLNELINSYGSGIGGVKTLRAKKYQPSLPLNVVDDVDEILTQNKNDVNDTFDYEQDDNTADGVEEEEEESERSAKETNQKSFKGDELFKEVQLPSSLVHKNWGDEDIESNPW
ncbi:uncharacterized protein AC631_01522 [Debaryomyces fabryi]|uniref:Dilute domain-containing protein n=1 Tax=Debaryomyces fabryi TaxID=58627 RepID=A0A0V1Q2N8_9ASCO|nr:uncharacterized protein AC631_01522 [Debaryomyces fabryi]KSA02722.1 hypothetical protein AC631_01522 [Debaryomyces fabryi]CUM56930.1 unnamed protein product [Debaryomyces fabryi]